MILLIDPQLSNRTLGGQCVRSGSVRDLAGAGRCCSQSLASVRLQSQEDEAVWNNREFMWAVWPRREPTTSRTEHETLSTLYPYPIFSSLRCVQRCCAACQPLLVHHENRRVGLAEDYGSVRMGVPHRAVIFRSASSAGCMVRWAAVARFWALRACFAPLCGRGFPGRQGAT